MPELLSIIRCYLPIDDNRWISWESLGITGDDCLLVVQFHLEDTITNTWTPIPPGIVMNLHTFHYKRYVDNKELDEKMPNKHRLYFVPANEQSTLLLPHQRDADDEGNVFVISPKPDDFLDESC